MKLLIAVLSWLAGFAAGAWFAAMSQREEPCRFRSGTSIDECRLPRGHRGFHAAWSRGDPEEWPRATERDAALARAEQAEAQVAKSERVAGTLQKVIGEMEREHAAALARVAEMEGQVAALREAFPEHDGYCGSVRYPGNYIQPPDPCTCGYEAVQTILKAPAVPTTPDALREAGAL
jgi:hypothetical protein